MVKLSNTFRKLKPIKVLVVGDFMVDRYTIGSVSRISPEAPVPILNVKEEKDLPGGAGNVALNLKKLDCDVSVLGRVGNDENGRNLIQLFSEQGIDSSGIFFQQEMPTILKNRLISSSQQLLRIDFEKVFAVSDEIVQKVELFLRQRPHFDVIAISDYAKGFLSDKLLKLVISYGNEKQIPVIVDPKSTDFSKYSGADVIKPNKKEAYEAAKLSIESSLNEVSNALFSAIEVKNLIITRSEEGISLINKQGTFDFPVVSKEVIDVTGAGDTVLAILALGLGNNIDLTQTIPVANIAAGIAIEHIGCALISRPAIARRILDLESHDCVLQEGQIETLKHLFATEEYKIICLDDKEENALSIFHAINNLSDEEKSQIILIQLMKTYSSKFISYLCSLPHVDHVLLPDTSIKDLLNSLDESNIYYFKNNSLRKNKRLKVIKT